MADRKPPIFETAALAWKDAFRAIDVMPAVLGIAFALHLVVSLTISAIGGSPYALIDSPWLSIIVIVANAVQAVLLAPLAIAVHRLVLLGETADHYPFEPKNSRFVRFVGFAILVKTLWLVPTTVDTLIPAVSVVTFVLLIPVVIMLVRRVILFPAIAIDAPGATWSKAGLDTKGSSWRVVFVFVLTALPVLIVNGLLGLLWFQLTPQAQSSAASFLFFSVIGSGIAIVALCSYAAAASHLFQARADAMTRPEATPLPSVPATIK